MKTKPFRPRKPDAEDGTWRMDQDDIERVQEFRKCIECFLCQGRLPRAAGARPPRGVYRPAAHGAQRGPGDAPPRHRGPPEGPQGRPGHRLLQHHQVLHERLPRRDHHHGQRHHSPEGTGRRRVLRPPQPAAADLQVEGQRGRGLVNLIN